MQILGIASLIWIFITNLSKVINSLKRHLYLVELMAQSGFGIILTALKNIIFIHQEKQKILRWIIHFAIYLKELISFSFIPIKSSTPLIILFIFIILTTGNIKQNFLITIKLSLQWLFLMKIH